jgi:hypothetical protein
LKKTETEILCAPVQSISKTEHKKPVRVNKCILYSKQKLTTAKADSSSSSCCIENVVLYRKNKNWLALWKKILSKKERKATYRRHRKPSGIEPA